MTADEQSSSSSGAAVSTSGIDPEQIQEVYMGTVLQAGVGQAPARQAAILAGLSKNTPCTAVNKVCASGMKAIMLAAQSLKCGDQDIIVAGGMDSMSNVPFYKERGISNASEDTLIDGVLFDGLTDAYMKCPMGIFAENHARDLNISREEQDKYAYNSHRKRDRALDSGKFKDELIPVIVEQEKGDVLVTDDEEYKHLDFSRLIKLNPAFEVSSVNVSCGTNTPWLDGDFPIAPVSAMTQLLSKHNMTNDDIAMWEINESFSLVVLVAIRMMELNPNKVNIHGGAVSLGHPLGMSGARIVTHLCHSLKSGQYGMAAICNGGGGASAMLIQKI